MTLPILDPNPSSRHVWSYPKIQMMKGAPEIAPFVPAWKNPHGKRVAKCNQDKRGTCTGYGTKFVAQIVYGMLTGDIPTAADIAGQRFDVIDAIGTRYDTGNERIEISAEGFYQLGRFVGNVTYPAGGDIRFTLKAWLKYGWYLEKQWHTDKEGLCVWAYPPGIDAARMVANNGVSWEQATAEAIKHKIEGYAMCGTPDGGATWDEVCSAIYNKGAVLAAIPIYESYQQMQGGDGFFPDPRGEIIGYHALCFYGYDGDNLYLIHSWGDWCGQFGGISRKYFNMAIDQSVWMLVLDKEETKIGEDIHTTLSITANVEAQITSNGVAVGKTPLKISLHKGEKYEISASADGYTTQSRTVDDSVKELIFTLEPLTVPIPPVKKGFWALLIEAAFEFLKAIFRRK